MADIGTTSLCADRLRLLAGMAGFATKKGEIYVHVRESWGVDPLRGEFGQGTWEYPCLPLVL